MPLLEREPYLKQLRELLVYARTGEGRLVLLAGEAGIGKTSLAAAFCGELGQQRLVLWGGCDPISPPRAFAPLLDIAASVGGDLREALDAADRDRALRSFLALLRRSTRSAVVVLDDLQWADEGTLDLLRVVGRRLSRLPVLLIGCYRDDEVGPDHPLRLALGDIPTAGVTEIAVPPLSPVAVGKMAAATGIDAAALYRRTGGNPFYVTEVLAANADSVPLTVRDAVAVRTRRLSRAAQACLRALSVLGPSARVDLLPSIFPASDSGFRECVERGLLEIDRDKVQFRHELARRAIYDDLDLAERHRLHVRALRALGLLANTGTAVDPGVLAGQAIGAGNATAVLRWVPRAARRAADLGAHREAEELYAAALPFAPGRNIRERAELLEARAHEAMLIDSIDAALASQQQAVELWHRLGDPIREGGALSELSYIVYLAGDGPRAVELAEAGVATLEEADDAGAALARASAVLAQRYFSRGIEDELAREAAGRALAIANRIHDEGVALHALTTIRSIDVYVGMDAAWTGLEEIASRATAAGMRETATRARINLVEAAIERHEFARADRYVEVALASLADQDLDMLARVLQGRLAELALQRGRLQEADDMSRVLLHRRQSANPIRVRALTIQGRLRTRLGDGDPWTSLDEALAIVAPGELQELVPLYAARAESALVERNRPRARDEAAAGMRLARTLYDETEAGWWWGELAYALWRTGGIDALPEASPEPYRLQAAGRHQAASAAWAALGCPFQGALALAESDREAELRAALDIFIGLGARPMARDVTRRLRAMGALGIPRGPRPATRRNLAGLTSRELEVLGLVRAGLRNNDIAEQLVIAPKTVDHHLSSILRKLGVQDRRAAAAKMGDRDAQDGRCQRVK